MAQQQQQTFNCLTCQKVKPVVCGKQGIPYLRCSDCYIESNQQFWVGKQNNTCKICNMVLPITSFNLDRNRCPWSSCRQCFSDSYKIKAAALKRSAETTIEKPECSEEKKMTPEQRMVEQLIGNKSLMAMFEKFMLTMHTTVE